MHSFRDMDHRPWEIRISVGAIRRVKARLDVDLLEIAGDGKLIERLTNDVGLLVDIVWLLVEAQATSKSISDEQFGESMGGDSLDKAANAFLEELADFFPNPKRGLLRAALRKVEQVKAAAERMGLERMENLDIPSHVRKIFDAPYGKPPASSESTPPNSPGENSNGWPTAAAVPTGVDLPA